MMADTIRAPFTPEQVGKLNRWQQAGTVHEATCPNEHTGSRILYATSSGLRCRMCGYHQTFAPRVMLEKPPAQVLAAGGGG